MDLGNNYNYQYASRYFGGSLKVVVASFKMRDKIKIFKHHGLHISKISFTGYCNTIHFMTLKSILSAKWNAMGNL